MAQYTEKRALDFGTGLVLEPYKPNGLHELNELEIEITYINQL